MSSYAMFTAKKGRPKAKPIEQTTQDLQCNQQKSSDADVLLSLFYLKKITEEQNDSAKFYQKLCQDYYRSIDSPIMTTSSFIRVENSYCRTKQHSTDKDQTTFMQWMDIKSELSKVDPNCEDILYKVAIENKMKYELLNPTNFIRNMLRILQQGLDKITEYRSKRANKNYTNN